MAAPVEEAAVQSAAEKKTKAEKPEAEQKPSIPPADPQTCRGLALCQEHLESGILDGEWKESEFLYYIEPAGILNAHFVCSRCHPEEERSAGIFMTKMAREARTVFFGDDINLESYELHFPKEYGYVKPRQHYDPASREHARYPWTKKY